MVDTPCLFLRVAAILKTLLGHIVAATSEKSAYNLLCVIFCLCRKIFQF